MITPIRFFLLLKFQVKFQVKPIENQFTKIEQCFQDLNERIVYDLCMVEIGQNMRNGYTFSSKVDIIGNCNALKTETSERPNLFRQNLRNLENKNSFVKVEPSANNMLCHIKKRKLLYR